MEELVSLMEKYSEGIASTLQPIAPADIDRLAEAFGALPGAYVRFLRTMGASTGRFQIEEGQADLKNDDNWELPEMFTWMKNSPFLYIGQDNSPNALDYFMDRTQPSGLDDCMVVNMVLADGSMPEALYVGLEEMLFYNVFQSLRLPQFRHHLAFSPSRISELSSRSKPEKVCAAAEALGFVRIPPATRCALYDREDAALLMYQTPKVDAFRFVLATNDPAELDRMAPLFLAELGPTMTYRREVSS